MQSETSNFENNGQNPPEPQNVAVKPEKETGKWFSKAMFLQTLNTFSPIPLVYFAMLFLALPMDIFLWDIPAIEFTTGLYKDLSTYANYGLRMGLPTAYLLGCLNAMMVFRYLCNNRSSNMVHSLPIKRESLFVTQYVAGLSFVILPNLALLVTTLIACAVHGIFYPEPFVIMFLVHCGLYTFFYSFAVFCAMLTGSVGSIFLYFLTFNFLVAFVTLLVQPLLEMFYLGYVGSTFSYPFVRWLTPLYALTYGSSVTPVYRYTAEAALPGGYFDPYPANISYTIGSEELLMGYALATVCFVVAGFFLYRARHIETAGEAVAAEWLKPLFRFFVGVIGGIAMGIVSTLFVITSYEDSIVSTILPLYSLGWCMVFIYLAEMVIQKSFRVWNAWKKSLLPMITVTAVFAWLVLDLGGFVYSVPSVEEVESVTISGLETYPADSASTVSDFPVVNGVVDQVLGQEVITLHASAIANAEDYLYRRQNALAMEGTQLNLYFHYKLLGEDITLDRGYSVLCDWNETEEEASLEAQISALANDKTRQDYSYQMERLIGNVETVQFTNTYDKEKDQFDVRELSEIDRDLSSYQLDIIREELAEAVLRDFEAGNIGEKFFNQRNERYLNESTSFKLVFSWEKPNENYHAATVSYSEAKPKELGESNEETEQGYTSVAITSQAKNTMKVLETYNLTERFQVLTNQEVLDLCVTWFEQYLETLNGDYLKKIEGTWMLTSEEQFETLGRNPMTYLYMLK